MEFDLDAVEEEDSPFPEVRASVSNIDDPEMPAMTMRMWVIGLALCMTARFVRSLLSSTRAPNPSVLFPAPAPFPRTSSAIPVPVPVPVSMFASPSLRFRLARPALPPPGFPLPAR